MMVEAFSEVSETSPDVAAGYLDSLASMAIWSRPSRRSLRPAPMWPQAISTLSHRWPWNRGKRVFYSKLEIPACIQGLTDFKLGARVSKIHDRISITHALVFIIFSGCATLECNYPRAGQPAGGSFMRTGFSGGVVS
jgi:hypothetical protein